MTDRPFAFHDLPASYFPVTIEMLRSDTKEVVHRIVVSGPGAVEIPALREREGVPIGVKMTTADGHVTESWPE
jgi:hypothetical protein